MAAKGTLENTILQGKFQRKRSLASKIVNGQCKGMDSAERKCDAEVATGREKSSAFRLHNGTNMSEVNRLHSKPQSIIIEQFVSNKLCIRWI